MTDPRHPAEPRIALSGAAKRFSDFTALAPLDLTVRQGEFVALLGPAGSGKTTALRLIAGLERPTAGSVSIDGFDVTTMPPQRRDVTFVFQSPALYPHMGVERNLAYPMRAQSIPRNVITRRVNQVIERLCLEPLRHRKPRKLSASERQLVSLGRAMVRDAKAFLLDEPLAPFAGEQREHMRHELRAVHEELRGTTILATRDPLDAVMLADRIIVMNEGRVLQSATPQDLYDRPADLFVAHYLGSAAMNFLDATVTDGAVRLTCCDLSFRVDDAGGHPVDPAKVTLGIRPEHVRLDPRGIPAVAGDTANDALDLRLGEASIRCLAPAQSQPTRGENVFVRFDPAGCRWFDTTSGKALPWRTLA
jgi:multiple sugar transport system ATP-binding protein